MWYKPVDHLCRKIAELLDLCLPLVLDRSRSNYKNPLNAPTAPQQLSSSDGLNCLAKAHIIGEDHPPATGGEQRSANLVGEKRHSQEAVERAFAFLQLRDVATLVFKARGEFVFMVNEIQYITVHNGGLVYGPQLLKDLFESSKIVLSKKPTGVEVLGDNFAEIRRRLRRKSEAHV